MHKISIKNFGPIEEITDLEVNRVMVLIGQQATGKSTLSKLIYFFQTIEFDILGSINKLAAKKNDELILETLNINLQKKFYQFFGLITNESFNAKYECSEELIFEISSNNEGSITLLIPVGFEKILDLSNEATKFLSKTDSGNKFFFNSKEHVEYTKFISDKIKNLNLNLRSVTESTLFIPAGRGFLSMIKPNYREQFYQMTYEEVIFDIFFEKFSDRIERIKNDDIFGKSLRQVIQVFQIQRGVSKIPYAKEFLTQMTKVLKGEYQLSGGGEKILLENGQSISMDYASSGQQETLWIMLDLFIAILKGEPAHFTIEEPEAHLYPIGQRNMVNLFSLFLAANPHNQLLITTHSPYILTAFNNLLFAGRIEASQNGETKEKVEMILKGGKSLQPKELGAYMMKGGKCQSIFSEKSGMIAENELDDASDEIMETFDELMNLYKK